ncbi:IS3 family transposase [Mesomycoplasma ovipneumoniae]|uniref:IS3 family transposase n=1 Tax=Mesomycoplasma ovipneumoniae TaxID=29562 RepID=UPI003080DD9B
MRFCAGIDNIRQNFENVAIAYQKISSFIHWYNNERFQSCLSYKSPSFHMS